MSELYVIGVCSNPVRFKSRIELYNRFRQHMKDSGVKLITVEIAFGNRPFEVTKSDDIHDLQLRSESELWHKENMVNLGIQYLSQIYPDWTKVAWVDGDVTFTRKNWAAEALHQLMHYQVVQLFEHAVDLGPDGQSLKTHTSFMSNYVKGKPYCFEKKIDGNYDQWHPGYCWAANREALDAMGGLIDFSILGAGDSHLAHCLINRAVKGRLAGGVVKGLHESYVNRIMTYQEQCERYIRRDVGYLPGTILHSWHGRKSLRGYTSRWNILIKNEYNPNRDIKRDSQGLFQLVDHGDVRSIRLRDAIRRYFRSRHEDSIDLE